MKASEAREIADNFYKEEVNYYFENIYSLERILEEIIKSAQDGYYGYETDFTPSDNISSKRAWELIEERFTNFFTDLGYKVEKSYQRTIEKSEKGDSIGKHPVLVISW